jgi:hypothetical protein
MVGQFFHSLQFGRRRTFWTTITSSTSVVGQVFYYSLQFWRRWTFLTTGKSHTNTVGQFVPPRTFSLSLLEGGGQINFSKPVYIPNNWFFFLGQFIECYILYLYLSSHWLPMYMCVYIVYVHIYNIYITYLKRGKSGLHPFFCLFFQNKDGLNLLLFCLWKFIFLWFFIYPN